MACYTMVRVEIEDTAINRKARKKLGLPLEGTLSQAAAALVRVEAGVLKTSALLRIQAPGAVVMRKGNVLTVTVNR